MLLRLLNKLNRTFVSKKAFNNIRSWEEEERFIHHFPEPKDDVQRAYFQYCCECFTLKNRALVFLRNMVAFVLLVFYYITRVRINKSNDCHDIVAIYDGTILDCIPDNYRKEMVQVHIGSVKNLSRYDKVFLAHIWKRYPFSFFFVFKIMVKLMTYSAVIEMCNPKEILCSSEASFTVSVLTKYCEEKGISHINFMHGLLGYKCRFAFSRFSKEIVWDECFVKAMKRLHHGTTKYEVSIPNSLCYEVKKEKEVKGQYTYYMQDLDDDLMKKLSDTYIKLKKKNVQTVFRPHPLFNDKRLIRKYIPDACIEDPTEVSIEESLNRAEVVIGRYSTVLYQAYLMKKNILIDDITKKEGSRNDIQRYIEIWLDNSEKYLLSKRLELPY